MHGFADRIVYLVLMLPVFIPAIVLHEYAHGWWAYRCGDMTAKMMGRLTLDPKAHFDPIGGLMFVLSSLSGIGFGWAKPVPVNFGALRRPVRDMIWVSAAGPISNLLQAAVWYLLYCALVFTLGPAPHALLRTPVSLLEVFYFLTAQGMILNLVLMAFNLLPIPPLDGSRILVGVLPYRYGAALASLEPYGMLILLVVLFTGLFDALLRPLIHLSFLLLSLPL
jgi:Zn-dependent protease